MPTTAAIKWFKQEFGDAIRAAVSGTVFSPDLVVALACQETGYIWQALYKKLPVQEVLNLCVGDTLDEDKGRRAFPRTKAALLEAPQGQAMFNLAHQALVDLARHIPAYRPASLKPDKFCHGFGIFQYDLQFFRTDPEYFLSRRYANFTFSLTKCLEELVAALGRMGGDWPFKGTLSEYEAACVAIAYNSGRFRPEKGLKQGHFNGTQHYGEAVFDFIRLAKTVA